MKEQDLETRDIIQVIWPDGLTTKNTRTIIELEQDLTDLLLEKALINKCQAALAKLDPADLQALIAAILED